MDAVSARGFGLLIAYVLPGFIALWGLGLRFESVRLWLHGQPDSGPGPGGIAYGLLASVAVGMTASLLRWAVVDSLHHRTGVRRPSWNDAALADRLPAYELFIEIHYRYYQFYGNSLISGLVTYGLWRCGAGSAWTDTAAVGLAGVFLAGSRDALRNYYRRTAALLGGERTVADDERRTPHGNDSRGAEGEAHAGPQGRRSGRHDQAGQGTGTGTLTAGPGRSGPPERP